MKKIYLILLFVLFFSSCKQEDKISFNLEELEIGDSKTRINKIYSLIDVFDTISTNNNIMNDYNLDNVTDSLPYDEFSLFFESEYNFNNIVKYNINDNQHFGHILLMENLIIKRVIKRSSSEVYYLKWYDYDHAKNWHKMDGITIYIEPEKIDFDCYFNNETSTIFTNLDSNIVREVFGFKGDINPYRYSELEIKIKFLDQKTITVDEFSLTLDSINYLKKQRYENSFE